MNQKGLICIAKKHFVEFEEKVWHENGNHKWYDYANKWIRADAIQYITNTCEGLKIYLAGRNSPIEVFGCVQDIIEEIEDAL